MTDLNMPKTKVLPLAAWSRQEGLPLDFVAVDMRKRALEILDARVKAMNLGNVESFAGRIEEYTGACDFVVSLHACGTASDHAIEAAMAAKAPYLVSPCCVGKLNLETMKGSGALQRPRSEWLSKQIGKEMYAQIAQAADRSEVSSTVDSSVSRLSKTVIELDRNQLAMEGACYDTSLLKMHGLEGYAKDDLLVGLPSEWMNAKGFPGNLVLH
uniref:Methyltransferase domain-containing protein n=1 Tax=Octactis speculum TaxID=3111310 RepID=A0A7S2ANF3_9STRA|mmetsp:Transcript_12435/g.16435  ORF Transcript_12435/g.16435 Transcript_12435/m.16435 type:complete len:213 (+) Transcript_12435:154-792(+)